MDNFEGGSSHIAQGFYLPLWSLFLESTGIWLCQVMDHGCFHNVQGCCALKVDKYIVRKEYEGSSC